MAKFSVIIPTFNRPVFLGQALRSVLAQRDANFEVLVVNDGDALGALPVDPRIHVIENGKRGAVAARNLALDHAEGDYLAFLDDDDIWTDSLHLASAAAVLDHAADFTFADGEMAYEDGRPAKPFAHFATAESLSRDNTILISAVCYRRALHTALGLFDEGLPYYWDWDWYLRVARSGARLQRIEKSVVTIRVHTANMSGQAQQRARADNLAALSLKHGLGQLELKNHTDFL